MNSYESSARRVSSVCTGVEQRSAYPPLIGQLENWYLTRTFGYRKHCCLIALSKTSSTVLKWYLNYVCMYGIVWGNVYEGVFRVQNHGLNALQLEFQAVRSSRQFPPSDFSPTEVCASTSWRTHGGLMDMSPLRPQNYLFGCELKADKDYHFKVDNDENEHQLSLRTPTVSLGGFEITPPVVLRLKYGPGPVHISGQQLVAVEEDAESEDEDEEDVKLLSMSGKRSAPGGGNKVPQKKVKLDEDDEDDDEDDEDDDEDDEDDDFDEEDVEEKVPVKKSVRDTPAKNAQKSNQNGKDLKPSTLRSKGQESFKKQEKTRKTPKGPSSVEDIKAKMQASIEKSH
ncbi:hypothetical protein STEG23_028341 [Scotinomys teguina]